MKRNGSKNKDFEIIVDGDVDLNFEDQKTSKKNKNSCLGLIIKVFLGILLLLVVMLVVLSFRRKNNDAEVVVSYENSGLYTYGRLINALFNYDAYALDIVVGYGEGDSYLAQEWAYVNGVTLREELLKKIANSVKFNYPLLQDGSDSLMNNGELLTVIHPDYEKIVATMHEDRSYIEALYISSGYTEKDYDFNDKMFNLLCQYVVDRLDIPVTSSDISLPLVMSSSGNLVISDDAVLDDLLFGSDSVREVYRTFSQLCLGWTGEKLERYIVQEEQHNPEYDAWYELFSYYYELDNGKFSKGRSKWEPWYVRDENNRLILDYEGNQIVNYYTVKDEDGNDWVQPDETIVVNVEKTRMVEDAWIEERGILYTMIGTDYLQNEYEGTSNTSFRVGDGSVERPAGIGTSIISKVLCEDGKYRDVRVTLLGYWTGKDAIDYVESFSTRNKGFTVTSVVQLICFEVQIENLSDEEITLSSEMILCDSNANISSRTGTVYDFIDTLTVKAGETVILNDWATSTELSQKYVCWGKSFERKYKMVYFNILAGSGDIPTYSAYEQFTGKSQLK